MPTVTVKGESREVAEDTRLVQAIETLGVAIGHRCGGKAACTTCRVRFISGEPETWTRAEFVKLGLDQPDAEAPGYRLSCQILCAHDMVLEPLMTLENQSWSDTGPAVKPQVQPEAQWYTPEQIARELKGE